MDQQDSRQPPWERLKGLIPDAAVALLLLVAGVCWRWSGMLGERLYPDNVYQYLRAHDWIAGFTGGLPGSAAQSWTELIWPASAPWLHLGPAAVWLFVPFVAGASDLAAAIERRLLVQALMALVLYFALRRSFGRPLLDGRRLSDEWPSILAALTAALAVGFTVEPFGTMTHGDESLLAPELAAVFVAAVAGVLLAGRRVLLCLACAVLPLAVMLHPYSACYVPGLLLVMVHVWRSGGRRIVLASLGVGALFAIPEALHLGHLLLDEQARSGMGDLLVLAGSAFESPLDPIVLSLVGFVVLEPFPIGVLLLLAPLVVLHWRRNGSWWRPSIGEATEPPAEHDLRAGATWFTIMTLLSLPTMLGLGIGFNLLRQYHWRPLLPALALQLGLAVFLLAHRYQNTARAGQRPGRRLAPWLLAAPAALMLLGATVDALGHSAAPNRGDAVMHRWIAEAVQQDAQDRPRWIDAVVLGWDERPRSWVFTPAVYLQQRMAGVPAQRFRLDGWLYLAVNGHAAHTDAVRLAMGWDEKALAEHGNLAGESATLVPLPAGGFSGVHLVGRYAVESDQAILLIRFDDWRASQQWTRWLAQHIAGGQAHLMLDANYYLPQCMPGYRTEYALRYFDPALVRCHANGDGPC